MLSNTPEAYKWNKSPRNNNSNSKTHGNKNNNNNNGGGGGKRGNSPKRRGKKGPTPVPGSDGKIAILKREGPAPVASSDAAPQPIPGSTLSSSSSSSVPTTGQYAVKDIQEAVRAEMHNSVIPTLADTVNHSIKQTLSNIVRKSVEDGMDKKSGVATDDVLAAVSSGVAVPVKEAFAEVSGAPMHIFWGRVACGHRCCVIVGVRFSCHCRCCCRCCCTITHKPVPPSPLMLVFLWLACPLVCPPPPFFRAW